MGFDACRFTTGPYSSPYAGPAFGYPPGYGGDPNLAGIELRCVFVQYFLHVPDDRVSGQVRAVMKLDAVAAWDFYWMIIFC